MLSAEQIGELNGRLELHARPRHLIAFARALDDEDPGCLELTAAVWVAGRWEAHSELVSQSSFEYLGASGVADRFVALVHGLFPGVH